MDIQALERFAAAFPEPILLVASDGRVQGANAAALKAYGLPRPWAAELSLSGLTRNSPEQLSRYLQRCADARRALPTRLHLKAPADKPLLVAGSLVIPATAREPALIALRAARAVRSQPLRAEPSVHRDDDNPLTSSQRSRRGLINQPEWLQATLESIGDAVIVTSAQGRVAFMNPTAERLTGWRQSEAVNRHVDETFRLVGEETGEVLENPCQQAIRGVHAITKLPEQTALIDRDDRVRPVHGRAVAIHDTNGGVTGVVLVFHDITELRRSEQQLSALNKMLERRLHARTAELERRGADLCASEQRLTLALEASAAGYYEHSVSLERGYVSERWAALLGYQLDELPPLPGLLPWWESCVHERDRSRVIQAYRNFLRGRGANLDIEYRIRHRSERWRWQRLTCRLVQRGPNAQASMVAGLVFDITAQKRSARRVHKLRRALERREVQRRALAGELSAAEQNERRRVAQLLHDHLQQSLVAADCKVAVLLDREDASPRRRELVALKGLIQEIVGVSRSLTLELNPPALAQGRLTAALKALGGLLKERYDVHVVVESPGGIKGIPEEEISDSIRVLLFQAARELLFNIVKHAQVDRAYLRVRRQANGVELEVVDCGVGMMRIADGDDRRDGFGLFSLRQRVEAHGGRLDIGGAAGLGTRVRLRVPLTSAPILEPHAAPRSAASPRRSNQAN